MASLIALALPLYGHMPSMLQLCSELTRVGKQLVVYATPSFAAAVAASGAAFRAYPSGLLDDLAYTPDFCERVMRCGAWMMRDELPRLRGLDAEALVYDATYPWGPALRDLLGIRAVSVTANFVYHDALRRMALNSQILPRDVVDMIAGMNARANAGAVAKSLQAEFGFAIPDVGGAPYPREALNLVFTPRIMHPFAEELDDRYLFVGPALPLTTVEPPASEDRGLIYVAFGTVMNTDRVLFQTCFDALRDAGMDVLASTGRAFAAPDFRDAEHVRVESFVKQSDVFRRAAATVTHGGLNTTCESLVHGVPVIVIPSAVDQEFVGTRVEELGCGIHVPRQFASAARVRAAVDEVLGSDRYRRACRRIRDSILEGGGAPRASDAVVALLGAKPPAPLAASPCCSSDTSPVSPE